MVELFTTLRQTTQSRVARFGIQRDGTVDGSFECLGIDGFHQILIGPREHPRELISLLDHRREDDQGDVLRGGIAPQRAHELQTIETRHFDIDDDTRWLHRHRPLLLPS